MALTAEQIAAVVADPENDDLRLAIAADLEASGDPRGEFIRLQVRRWQDEVRKGEPCDVPGSRESELLQQHWASWTEPLAPHVVAVSRDAGQWFLRGFASWVRVHLPIDAAAVDRVFALAPIQHVSFESGGVDRLRVFLGTRYARSIRSLAFWSTRLGDEGAALIADCEALRGLRWLWVAHAGIGERGVEALMTSPHMASLQIVNLDGNPCDPIERGTVCEWEGDYGPYPPAIQHELIQRHGDRVWLHVRDWPGNRVPDRYHV